MDAIKRAFQLASELSIFLLIGTIAALIWANIDYEAYHHFIDGPLFGIKFFDDPARHVHGAPINLHFVINDMFMAFFFGIAMKEVSESFLPGGALSSVKKAAMPAIATAGGVFGPIGMFFILTMVMSPEGVDITRAWAVPTATDIAYCWLFARLIFGAVHPAVTFLLVLAVLDDLIGMMIIATFYTDEVHMEWMGLVALAIIICETMRRLGVKSFWPYVLIGAPLSWIGLLETGVHAALAFVPIVPFMPHAERDAGLFVDVEDAHHHDTLSNFEHFFKPFVDTGLIFFGLANAGVLLSGESLSGGATWIIFLALLIGKTVGIVLFSFVGTSAGLKLPKHMTMKTMVVVGCVAGIGFTVALFVTTVAFNPDDPTTYPGTAIIDQLKLGALLSFAAGPIAWMMSKGFGIEKLNKLPEAEGGHGHSQGHGHHAEDEDPARAPKDKAYEEALAAAGDDEEE